MGDARRLGLRPGAHPPTAVTRRVIDAAQLAKVKADLEAIGQDYNLALRAELYDAGWRILDASQEIVPVEWGTLKASGNVSLPTEANPVCLVSYGGPASAYARYQHEGVRADGTHRITKHSEPGKSTHYLQIPFEAEIAEWPKKLIQGIYANRR